MPGTFLTCSVWDTLVSPTHRRELGGIETIGGMSVAGPGFELRAIMIHCAGYNSSSSPNRRVKLCFFVSVFCKIALSGFSTGFCKRLCGCILVKEEEGCE